MSVAFDPSWVAEAETGDFCFAPVDRTRLARYLEVPSVAELDEITTAEIDRLDGRRDELLTFWKRAIAAPIDRVEGPWIELEGGARIQTTPAYGRQLARHGVDWLVVAGFTIGGTVDARAQEHLDKDELLEAFVLKRWAATMTEQARAWLTLALCGWADRRGRSLLPFSGPGYNGWPLAETASLLALIDPPGRTGAAAAIRATESGLLLPINSMLIVHGATPRRAAQRRPESLAQCHRCGMRNCRYRVAALDADAAAEIVGVAG